MKITGINLTGNGACPQVSLDGLVPGLNVIHSGNRGGKSALAGLIAHLLYGKTESAHRFRVRPEDAVASGTLLVCKDANDYVLERKNHGQGGSQLFVSGTDGQHTDTRWLHSALGDLPLKSAANLLAVDFQSAPDPLLLLDSPFAQYLGAQLPHENRNAVAHKPIDKQRVEELVRRRNAIAQQLEERMHAGRRDSHLLEQEAAQVDAALKNRRQQIDELQSQLQDVESKLSRLDTTLRYHSLDQHSTRPSHHCTDEHERQLRELDEEILRCRQTLTDTQARSANLHTELAKLTADGSAPRVTALAESRRTVGVLERLIDDLDSEVAQLARTTQSQHSIEEDAHARFSPIAELLRKQVYSLCGQISEQQRNAKRQAVQNELHQLNRVQIELADRLEQLLTNREALLESARTPHYAGPVTPTSPVVDYCDCEQHGHHVSASHRDANWANESDAAEMRGLLERDRYQLLNQLSALGREVVQLETTWKRLQEERAGLVEGSSIEADRAEIDRLESLLKQALDVQVLDPAQGFADHWTVSDIFAQLTNGKFAQVRLSRDQQTIRVVDKQRQAHHAGSLKPAERDQLYLALTLSLVSSFATQGVTLPLVLDEPFLRQDPADAAVMAGVLDRFGRAGHQVLLLTDHSRALDSFESLSTHIVELGREALAPVPRTTSVKKKSSRLVRETFDGEQSPGLRLASGHGAGNIEAVFYLSTHSSLNEFPVLGKDTATVFSRLEIHTVGDLLDADAKTIARRLDRDDISEATVSLWQSHMRLLCEVPELTLNDAQLLTAVGIMSPHDLRHAHTGDLWTLISSFLESERNGRFETNRSRYSRSRTDDWIYAAGGARERSSRRGASSSSNSSRRNASRGNRSRSNGSRSRRNGDARRTSSNGSDRQSHEWRFHLELSSDVEAAPSIGPKTAERLAKVGIHTVNDLLEADPESTAELLDTRHIRSKTILEWQNQARLVCQIPELHGYGAMLLVACGLTKPNEISSFDPTELISRVQEFCETKQGQRILRSAEAPSAKRISRWIELAQHCRSLEAA